MGSTSNYSWPTPEQTDLVKDGWDAIKDLGDAADTTVKAVADGRGLVHIETQTISATPSAVNFNNVFSATYDNYRIILDLEASGSADVLMRLRASGSDASGSNYNFIFTSLITSAAVSSNVNQTSMIVGVLRASHKSSYVVEVSRPFLAEKTRTITNGTRTFDAVQGYIFNGEHQLTTSYDGFSLIASSGTFVSGQISVYGYRK